MNKPLPCIVCGFQPEPVGGSGHQPYDALIFNAGAGHYGSTVWDEMSGSRSLTINVCDKCLVANRGRVAVAVYIRPEPPDVEFVPWEVDAEDGAE